MSGSTNPTGATPAGVSSSALPHTDAAASTDLVMILQADSDQVMRDRLQPRAQLLAGTVATSTVGQPGGVAALDGAGRITAPVAADLAAASLGTTALTTVGARASNAWRLVDDVTRRAPRGSDDSTTGYEIDDLWNVPGRGLWRCRDATPGHALWEPCPTGVLPLDAVPGVELHGYGTRRLSAAFAGAAPLQVLFAGSTPADVPFGADDNIDRRSLALLSGAVSQPSDTTSPQMWGAAVSKWYDQAPSGTRHDLTVPANCAHPQISSLAQSHGSPSVTFASGGLNWLTDYQSYASNIQNPRLFNADVAASSTNLSVMMVIRGGPIGGTIETPVSFTDSYPINVNTMDVTLTSPFYAPASCGVGTENSFGFFIPSSPCVYGVNFGASGVTAFVDDLGDASIGPMLADNTAKGLWVGGCQVTTNADGTTSTSGGYGVALNCVVYGPALTAAQSMALRMAIVDTFCMAPQVRARVVQTGASTEAGADGWACKAPCRFGVDSLKSPVVLYNFSIGGSGFVHNGAGTVNGVNEIWARGAQSVYVSYAPCVYLTGEGSLINQYGTGSTVAQTFADWQTWVLDARALGDNVSIVAETVAPCAAFQATDSDRLALNALIRSATITDALCDAAANPVLGSLGILTSRQWTVDGGGHRSPYWQAMKGILLGTAIEQALERPDF